MSFGLDYVSGPSIAAMKAHVPPVEFVCRYTGYFSGYDIAHPERPQGKCLTPGEALALSKAGIALVSNWEWSANRAVQGRAAGEWDADKAATIHHACGGPADRPIYFSVDVDVAGVSVAAYFKGVASAIGLHRTGAYGSFRVLQYLFDQGLIAWGWQTYAWSYGQWEGRAHIQQYSNGVNMAGHSVDYNQSIKSDFGQWFYGGGEENVTIDIHTPGISTEFDEIDAQHWRSKRSGKIIQHAYLANYKTYGNAGLCGLKFLGHPMSDEVYYAPGKSRQNYQFGVQGWDATHGCYPLALYDPNSPGQDPRVAPLQVQAAKDQGDIAVLTKQASDLQAQVQSQEAQITQLQAEVQSQPSAIPADVQAKLDHDEQVLNQMRILLQS